MSSQVHRYSRVKPAVVRHRSGQSWPVPNSIKRYGMAIAVFVVGPLLLAALSLLHVSQGQYAIDSRTIVEALVVPEDTLAHSIVRYVRLPRLTVALLSGMALAAAGVLLQGVTRNPLASPATLGVNAGAYFALVAATIFAPSFLDISPVLMAFGGGMLAAGLVYVMAAGSGQTAPVRLALAGVAVSLALSALTGTLQLIYENETAGLFYWGAGSLLQNDWDNAAYAWPRIAAGLGLALLLASSLDVLRLGDDVARGLGLRVAQTRFFATVVAVFLAAVAVSITGPIGFIGLIVPHGIRLAGFQRHRLLLLGALIWGAITLVAADMAARWVNPSISELPAGVVTALIGTPFFVWLARRAGTTTGRTRTPENLFPSRVSGRVAYPWIVLFASALFVAMLAAGLVLGDASLNIGDVVRTLTGTGSAFEEQVVVDLRLPRLLVAATAGAGLAVSGVLFQGVIRNPLASPATLGITSGAGLGGLTILIALPAAPIALVPVAAFVGALGAFGVVYVVAWRGNLSPARLALVGIAVSAFCAAAINLLVVRADVRVASALVWLSGSTYARGWEDLIRLLPWPLILIPAAWLLARALDLLGLGDDVARGLGLRLEQMRLAILLTAVGLAASVVATVGTISFVGLIAPHMARLLSGNRHARLIPLSAILGAIVVVFADTTGRTILAPKEIPSGLVTALIGAPYFLWLLWHSRKRTPGT